MLPEVQLLCLLKGSAYPLISVFYSMKGSWWKRIRAESRLAFDLVVNDRVKAHVLQAIPFWVASLLTGLVAVAYTRLFSFAEELLRVSLQWHSWSLFFIMPLSFFCAWWTVQKFAPAARGSGIPQVMAAIEIAVPARQKGLKVLLGLKIIAIKILSSLLMVFGGGAVGREGPTIQISGSIFHLVQKWVPASWPKLSDQRFILTGAAAGLAAAFNTPLGGVVFAMEELAKIHIKHFRTALFSAVIIAGLTAQGLLGPYLYLGFPDVSNLKISIYVGVAATAILTGLAGSYMCKGILRIMEWKKQFSKTQSILFILIAGLGLASIAYFLNENVLGSGKELMTRELFSEEKAVSWDTALLRVFGPMVCFNVGASGGIFAPALAAGASIGGFVSDVFNLGGSNANILILAGMVGFLTGVTRTPFTSAILVLEMTDRHSVIFHLMLAALLSNIAAIIVDKHSFYDQLKKNYIAEADAQA